MQRRLASSASVSDSYRSKKRRTAIATAPIPAETGEEPTKSQTQTHQPSCDASKSAAEPGMLASSVEASTNSSEPVIPNPTVSLGLKR